MTPQEKQQLEDRLKKLEDNQVGVIMSNNADLNILRALQRALTDNTLTIGSNATAAPTGSALLVLDSISKGLLFPRMTTGQRDAIVNPTAGLVIYNLTTNVLNFYSGSAWAAV